MWKVSRKYLLGAAFAGVAALGVTQAQAQGPWSGPYFGLHAGYGWGDTNVTHDIGVPAVNPHDTFNTKGWLLGAQLGLNVQVGSFVLGGEFSLSDANIKGSKANCAPVLFGPGIATCSKEDDWLLLAMGKVGYAFSSNVMAYGTAGLAVAGVTANDVLPAPDQSQPVQNLTPFTMAGPMAPASTTAYLWCPVLDMEWVAGRAGWSVSNTCT